MVKPAALVCWAAAYEWRATGKQCSMEPVKVAPDAHHLWPSLTGCEWYFTKSLDQQRQVTAPKIYNLL